MAIDVAGLVQQMLSAAQGTLSKKQWSDARDYAEKEFQGIAGAIAFIETKKQAGEMTAEEAQLHLSIQRNTARTVLLTLKGIGLLQAEAAINAALAVVQKTVNTALGFRLIG
jgi:hypothetical protein